MMLAFVFALVMNGISYWFSDKIMLRIYGAQESDPLSLASALRKLQLATERTPMTANPATAHMFIVNPFTGGGLMALFSTHPPVKERVRRLEAMKVGLNQKYS